MDLSALKDALEADPSGEDMKIEKLKEFNTSNADTTEFDSALKPTLIALLLKHLREQLHSVQFTDESSTQSLQYLLAGTNTLRLLTRDGTTDELIELSNLQHIASTAGLYYQETPYCLAMKKLFSTSSPMQTNAWIEGTKTLINIIYVNHSSILISNILETLYKIGLLEQLLERMRVYLVDKTNSLPLDLTKFDVKLLFLLTACSATERDRVLAETDGFSTISSLIHQWIHFSFRPDLPKIPKKYLITELTRDADTALLEGELLLTSDILFDAVCAPSLPEERIVAIIVDSLKVLFSLTANWSSNFFGKPSNKQCLRTLYNDLRLVIVSFSEWTHSQTYTRLFNDCVNLMMNIPYPVIPVLIPKTGNVVSKRARDVTPPPCPVSPQEQGANKGAAQSPLLLLPYEDRNLSLVKLLVDRLDQELECSEESRSEMTLTKITLLPTLRTLARGSPTIRHYVRRRVLPPLGQVTARPEDGDDIKARVVKLMVHADHSLAYTTADFLFVLCKENVDRLVKYTGFGNAAGILMQRGLLGGGAHEGEGDYSSDSEDSDTDEFMQCQAGLDPITAAPKSTEPSVLDSMTEEEKEAEVSKLIDAIDKLNKTGVIKLMDTSGKEVGPESIHTEK